MTCRTRRRTKAGLKTVYDCVHYYNTPTKCTHHNYIYYDDICQMVQERIANLLHHLVDRIEVEHVKKIDGVKSQQITIFYHSIGQELAYKTLVRYDNCAETNLYYLSGRYYDPEVGRFISPDSIEYLDPETISVINLYAYCRNNPIMYYDRTGHSWESFWNGVGNWWKGNWQWVAGGAIIAASIVATIFVPALGALWIPTVIGACLGMIGGGLTFTDEHIGWNWDNAKQSFFEGALTGILSGILGNGFSGNNFKGFTKILARGTFGMLSSSVFYIVPAAIKGDLNAFSLGTGIIPGSEKWVTALAFGLTTGLVEKTVDIIMNYYKNKRSIYLIYKQ